MRQADIHLHGDRVGHTGGRNEFGADGHGDVEWPRPSQSVSQLNLHSRCSGISGQRPNPMQLPARVHAR